MKVDQKVRDPTQRNHSFACHRIRSALTLENQPLDPRKCQCVTVALLVNPANTIQSFNIPIWSIQMVQLLYHK